MKNVFKVSGTGVQSMELLRTYDDEFHYKEVDSEQWSIESTSNLDVKGGDFFTSIEEVNEELMRRIKIYQDCLLRQKKKM